MKPSTLIPFGSKAPGDVAWDAVDGLAQVTGGAGIAAARTLHLRAGDVVVPEKHRLGSEPG